MWLIIRYVSMWLLLISLWHASSNWSINRSCWCILLGLSIVFVSLIFSVGSFCLHYNTQWLLQIFRIFSHRYSIICITKIVDTITSHFDFCYIFDFSLSILFLTAIRYFSLSKYCCNINISKCVSLHLFYWQPINFTLIFMDLSVCVRAQISFCARWISNSSSDHSKHKQQISITLLLPGV